MPTIAKGLKCNIHYVHLNNNEDLVVFFVKDLKNVHLKLGVDAIELNNCKITEKRVTSLVIRKIVSMCCKPASLPCKTTFKNMQIL